MVSEAKLVSSDQVRLGGSIHTKDLLGDLQVSSVAHAIWGRVLVVVTSVAVRPEPVKVLHSKVKTLKRHHKLIINPINLKQRERKSCLIPGRKISSSHNT